MLRLFWAELKRNWLLFKRYPTEAISGVLGITIIFYGLFLSFKYVGGAGMQFGDRLDAVIVSYVLWSLTLFVIGDIAQGLQREAQTGTLEQIFLSPFSAMWVFLLRAIASLTTQLALTVSTLVLIMWLTGIAGSLWICPGNWCPGITHQTSSTIVGYFPIHAIFCAVSSHRKLGRSVSICGLVFAHVTWCWTITRDHGTGAHIRSHPICDRSRQWIGLLWARIIGFPLG